MLNSPALYDELQEGHRYRFYNVKPECFYRDSYRTNHVKDAILLQFQNGKSKIENVQ